MNVIELPLGGAEPPQPPGLFGIRVKARPDRTDPVAALVMRGIDGEMFEVELERDQLEGLAKDIADTRGFLRQLDMAGEELATADGNVVLFRPRRRS
jgi:hypothetical protein